MAGAVYMLAEGKGSSSVVYIYWCVQRWAGVRLRANFFIALGAVPTFRISLECLYLMSCFLNRWGKG